MGEKYRITIDKKIATAAAIAIGEFRILLNAGDFFIFCRLPQGVYRRSAGPRQCKILIELA